jgi:hypothetical protein
MRVMHTFLLARSNCRQPSEPRWYRLGQSMSMSIAVVAVMTITRGMRDGV